MDHLSPQQRAWLTIANGYGYDIRHDMHGYYACTFEEAAHEDEGNNSVGFDGREHYTSLEACAMAVHDIGHHADAEFA